MAVEHVEPSGTQPERWGQLGSFLVASFYLWAVLWLAAFVAVPAVGFSWEPVVITSGSMEPLIRRGDVVLLDPTHHADLAPGTVITYDDPLRPGTLTTHRIVGVDAEGAYTTRGDANQSPDPAPVPAAAVAGTGRLLVPMIGLPLVWLRGSLALFAVWAVATLLACAVATQRSGPAVGDHGDDGGDDGDDGDGPPPSDPGDALAEPEVTIRLPEATLRIPEARPRVTRMVRDLSPARVEARLVARGAGVLRRVLAAPAVSVTGRVVAPAVRRLVALATSSRPAAGRVRTLAPLAVAAALPLATRRPAGLALAVVAPVVVLLLDPNGPELRIGRAVARVRSVTAAATDRLPSVPRPRVTLPSFGPALRPAALALVLLAAGGSVVARSQAAFSATTTTAGSTISTAVASSTCTPGSVTLRTSVTQVNEDGTASATDAGNASLTGGIGTRTRLVLRPDSLAVPTGCRVTTGVLTLTTGPSAVDPTAVALAPLATAVAASPTWTTLPAAAAPQVSAALPARAVTTVDVTTIATAWAAGLPQHGMLLRLADETSGSLQVRNNAGAGTERPTLTVSWGP